MDAKRRRRIGGWGLVAAGTAGMVLSFGVEGLAALLTALMFAAVAISGIALHGERKRLFYGLFPVVGVFALLQAVLFSLGGVTPLTLAFALLGVVILAGSVHAYRNLS